MKKRIHIILIVLGFAFLNVGCNTIDDISLQDGDLVAVPLHFSGDIIVEETPLDTKGESSSSNDLYGIQVYQNGEKYAYGLFDNVSNLLLYLHSGKEYKIICTLIKDGKNSLRLFKNTNGNSIYEFYYEKAYSYGSSGSVLVSYSGKSRVNVDHNVGYGFPFGVTTGNCSDPTDLEVAWSVYAQNVNNAFVYSNTANMPYLSGGRTVTVLSTDQLLYHSPSVDRYYGEVDHFVPSPNSSICIDLTRVSYGIKYSVSGISDGYVSVLIKNNNRTFFNDSNISTSYTSPEQVSCFENIVEAWTYNDYTENVSIGMRWMRGVGIEQDLGSQVMQVKKGALNNITIALDTD